MVAILGRMTLFVWMMILIEHNKLGIFKKIETLKVAVFLPRQKHRNLF